MPVTRPEDKGKDRAQWWKDASTETVEEEDAHKLHHAPYNQQNKDKNIFDEEMDEVKHPT
jgi:hypothetical protein